MPRETRMAAPVSIIRLLCPARPKVLDKLFKLPQFIIVDVLPPDDLPAALPPKRKIPGPMIILLRYRNMGHQATSSHFGRVAAEPKQSACGGKLFHAPL